MLVLWLIRETRPAVTAATASIGLPPVIFLGTTLFFAWKQKKTPTDVDYEAVGERLMTAVEAGKMTREEAAEKLEAYKKRMGGER